MSDIPSQVQLERMLDDIRADAEKIPDLWRWVSPSSYARTSHPGVGGGGDADVGTEVEQTERVRRLVRHAGREVLDARNRLATAISDLNRAFAVLESAHVNQQEVADENLRHHRQGRREMMRLQAAKSRRQKRAEKSGDYGEVTG